MTRVIVGMDESDGAALALRWAVAEGAGRNWQVRAVLAWGFLDQHRLDAAGTFDPRYDEAAARETLAAAVERAVGAQAAPGVELEVTCDLALSALVERSAHSDLLVVGSRGRGGFKSLLVGSVSDQCLRHAQCPVVVVRPGTGPAGQPAQRIVVGVDGSPTAQRALQWALDLARPVDAEVEVVHTWQPPFAGGPLTTAFDPQMGHDTAQRTLDEALAAADATGLRIVRNVDCAGAAAALIDAAHQADLVVVGSRGRGGFAGLLLGSVSLQVAHHAPCPVVVVPPDGPHLP